MNVLKGFVSVPRPGLSLKTLTAVFQEPRLSGQNQSKTVCLQPKTFMQNQTIWHVLVCHSYTVSCSNAYV